jgi:uncharacterized hydrophobic protein (TIGR00271 family)
LAAESNTRHSRYLSLLDATTITSNITVGAGVFLIIGLVFATTGRQTPQAYFLSTAFFLPIIFTLAERVLAYSHQHGIIQSLTPKGGILVRYAVGWVMLGGLLLLTALAGWISGVHVSLLISERLALTTPISPELLAIFFIALIALNRYFGLQADWKRRRIILICGIVLLAFILISAWEDPPSSITGYSYLPEGNSLDGLPFLALPFWGIVFLAGRHHQVRRQRVSLLSAMLFGLFAMAIIGGGISLFLIQYPQVVVNVATPLISLAKAVGPLSEFLLLLAVILIAFTATDQVVTNTVRLTGDMIDLGFLPGQLRRNSTSREISLPVMALFILISAGSAFFLRPIMLITGTSMALFVTIAVAHLPGLFQTQSPLPNNRPLRLPFHPLLPISTVIICISLAISLSPTDTLPFFVWLGAGVLLYGAYSRRTAIAIRRQQEVVTGTISPLQEKTKPRLMVAIADPQKAHNLVQAGVHIAQARDYELHILQVVLIPETHTAGTHITGQNHAWELLNNLVEDQRSPDLDITPMVRLAPSVLEGIESTLWEEQIDSLLLGWPTKDDAPALLAQNGIVELLVLQAACEILIIRGDLPERVDRVLVPLTSHAHASAALALGRDLIRPETGRITAFKPLRGDLTATNEAAANAEIESALKKLPETTGIERQIVPVDDLQVEIVSQSANYDLTLMGVSGEGFLAQTYFGGLPVSVAQAQPNRPVILVKRKETQSSYLARQGWDRLNATLPTLSPNRQREVRSGMVRDARAGIDFYVLIILSASIAFLGLLQNSAAVIIGAMLVAPLMSPILAMAFGIVRGNVPATRQAANSTVNGVVLAITLPTLITFFLSAISFGSLEATTEILGRTQPGILDLMVALLSGAAAAYAISRAEVAAALPGVAIAAALVPPLAVVGYGLGTVQFDYALGALLLFLTNLAAIVLSGALMFLLLGFRPPILEERNESTRKGLQLALLGLGIISIPLVLATISARNNYQRELTVREIIQSTWRENEVELAELNISADRRETVVSLSLLDYANKATPYEISALQERLSVALEENVSVEARVVSARLDNIDQFTILPSPTPTGTITPTITATVEATATIQVTIPAAIETATQIPLPSPTLIITVTPTLLPTSTTTPTVNIPTPTDAPPAPSTTATPPLTPTPGITVTATLMPPTPGFTATATLPPTSTVIIPPPGSSITATVPPPTATEPSIPATTP